MNRTAIAYIDGFNFYHGVVKDTPHVKWLDFAALCDRLLRGDPIVRVNYYTARVSDHPTDRGQSQRQDDYLRALEVDDRVHVHFGQFQRKRSRVDASGGQVVALEDGTTGVLASGQRIRGKVWEEKGSDVNLGTDLSWDAAQANLHVALVLSNDLDLQRPVQRAVDSGIEVIVVNPHHRTNHRPSVIGSGTRRLKVGDLRACQLPESVALNDGATVVRRPSAWA